MQLSLTEIHVDDRSIHCYALSLTFSLQFISSKEKKLVKTGPAKTGPAGPLATGMMNACIMPCLVYGRSLFIQSWLLQTIPGADVILIIVM